MKAFFAAAVVCLSSAAFAQAPVANANPKAVEAGTYGVEPKHTRILFSVSHLGFSTYYGQFIGASGSLTLDPNEPAASKIDVSVPVASVTTTSAKLDGELKSADWFDAAKFPEMHFVSTAVKPQGGSKAQVRGNLTLHGVTKPIILEVTFHGSGINPLNKHYTAGFDATGTISRSAFGVTKYVPLVGDEVKLIISAAFEKSN